MKNDDQDQTAENWGTLDEDLQGSAIIKTPENPVYTQDRIFYLIAISTLSFVSLIAIGGITYMEIKGIQVGQGMFTVLGASIGSLGTLFTRR